MPVELLLYERYNNALQNEKLTFICFSKGLSSSPTKYKVNFFGGLYSR